MLALDVEPASLDAQTLTLDAGRPSLDSQLLALDAIQQTLHVAYEYINFGGFL